MGWLHIRMARWWSGRVWLGIRLLSVLALLQLERKSGAQVPDGVHFFQIVCTIMHSNMRVLKLRLPIGFELLANYMSYSIRELAILFLCNVSGIYFWRSVLDLISSVSGFHFFLSTRMKFLCMSHAYLLWYIAWYIFDVQIWSCSHYPVSFGRSCGLHTVALYNCQSVMPL